MNEISELLWKINADEVRKYYHKIAGKGSKPKADMIDEILRVLENNNTWLEEYFLNLKGFDLEYTKLLVKHNFHPIEDDLKELCKKYNIQTDWYGRPKVNLLFMINGVVPKLFKEPLRKLVPPIEFEFKGFDEIQDNDFTINYINEENPIQKFDDFIKFINQNKVKVTDKQQLITKNNILKFYQNYFHQEIAKNENNILEEIKNQNDTIVINGIETILLSADVIKISNGYITLGENYKDYVKMTKLEKTKFLFNEYINSTTIDELNYLKSGIYNYRDNYLIEPRNFIIDFIKKLPINKWVSSYDLKRAMRIKDFNFLRSYTGTVTKKSEYDNWYYSCDFEEFDYEFIDIVLFNYLAVLGILDITLDFGYTGDYNYRFYVSANEIKITKFGAMILDLIEIKEELEDNKNSELIITDDFEIIIENSSKSMEYELYFDRFLEGIKTSDKIVFELNFIGFSKAKDLGINPNEIIEYILSNSRNVPQKVLETFANWTNYLGKIKIKNKIVLEGPEDIINELLSDKKIFNLQEKHNDKKVIIKDNKSKDLKRLIESHEMFCDIEN